MSSQLGSIVPKFQASAAVAEVGVANRLGEQQYFVSLRFLASFGSTGGQAGSGRLVAGVYAGARGVLHFSLFVLICRTAQAPLPLRLGR